MSANYSSLCRAQLTYEYLHTNSTTHEFLFGALAELVDNSRDAGATKMHIFTVPTERYRGNFLLNFLDDGCGMDPVELSQVIQFGRSMKRNAGSNQIGQYGNGLKSGSMRIGKDMILLTKKGSTMSCLFLSRTFHEQEGIYEVIVPMPSWNADTKEPLMKDEAEAQRHEIEMDIILKHSPFHTKEELLKQFDEIEGETGTLVIIYNLKLLDNGEAELDFTTNSEDILMKDPHADEEYGFDEYIPPERTSFRSYASVLYSEPRMRILIQKKKVRTKRFINCIYKPISYSYTSNRFRTRSEKEVEKAEYEAKIADEKAKELAIQAKRLHKRWREAMPRDNISAKNNRKENQTRQMKAEQARIDAEVKKRIAEEKKKSLKEPKQLTFTFGFNIDARKGDGMYIYNCNRLIRMCEKIGPQLEGGVKCSGVVGIVDVPYLVLEPTHNKQDFADAKEYKHLLRSMAEHMLQYWKDSKIEGVLEIPDTYWTEKHQGVTAFWEGFGYTGRWSDPPSNEQRFSLKRAMSVPLCVQCDSCLKWRTLQFSRKVTKDNIPDNWVCALNSDNNFKTCTKPEQKPNIPMGKIQKEIKSVEQRAEQDIKRLKEKLNKAEKIAGRNKPAPPPVTPTVSSRRSISKPSPAPPPEPVRSKLTRGRQQSPEQAVQQALSEIRSPPRTRKPEPKKAEPPKRQRAPSPPPKKTAPPPAKSIRKPEKKPEKKPEPAKREPVKKRPVVESSEEEEEDTKPIVAKRKKTSTPSKTTENHVTSNQREVNSTTAEENQRTTEDTSEDSKFDTVYQIGCRVEARINTRWYSGKVISLKQASGVIKVKVKFDLHSQDKFDKCFNENDPNLRILKDEEPTSPDTARPEVTSATNNEISSSIASPSSTNEERSQDSDKLKSVQELLDGVTQKFRVALWAHWRERMDLEKAKNLRQRRCLHYFRPPDFAIEKNDILHNLTPFELRDFDLGKFVADYERNIRRLVGNQENFQQRVKEEVEKQTKELMEEKARKEKQLEESNKKLAASDEVLKSLRLNVNVVVRNILGDKAIEPADASEHVDESLQTIVRQIEEET